MKISTACAFSISLSLVGGNARWMASLTSTGSAFSQQPRLASTFYLHLCRINYLCWNKFSCFFPSWRSSTGPGTFEHSMFSSKIQMAELAGAKVPHDARTYTGKLIIYSFHCSFPTRRQQALAGTTMTIIIIISVTHLFFFHLANRIIAYASSDAAVYF